MAIHDDQSKRLTEELQTYMQHNKLSKSALARLLKMTTGSLGNYMEGIANVGKRIEGRLSSLGIDMFYVRTGYKKTDFKDKSRDNYVSNPQVDMMVSEHLAKYTAKSGGSMDILIRSLMNENVVLRTEIDNLRNVIYTKIEME